MIDDYVKYIINILLFLIFFWCTCPMEIIDTFLLLKKKHTQKKPFKVAFFLDTVKVISLKLHIVGVCVCPREIIYFLGGCQVSGHVENFNTGIFFRHHKWNICQTLHDGTAHLALPVHYTFSDFDSISRSQQQTVSTDGIMYFPIKFKLCRIDKYIKQVMNVSLFLTHEHIQGGLIIDVFSDLT